MATTTGTQEGPEQRVQVPVRLEVSVLDRLDRIIWHTGKGRNKQSLLEEAVLDLLDKIEGVENRGRPFPPIPEQAKKRVKQRRKTNDTP